MLGQSPARACTRRRGSWKRTRFPHPLSHTNRTLMLQKSPLLRAHQRSKNDFRTPLILYFFFFLEPHRAFGLRFNILVLRNNFIPRRCCSQTAQRQDIMQCYVLVSSKQIIPVEAQAGLLQQEGSCSSSLPFPSFPQGMRSVGSQAIPPTLVLQSLASSHVSMVIVAGDPFTATNSKKEKKKNPRS